MPILAVASHMGGHGLDEVKPNGICLDAVLLNGICLDAVLPNGMLQVLVKTK